MPPEPDRAALARAVVRAASRHRRRRPDLLHADRARRGDGAAQRRRQLLRGLGQRRAMSGGVDGLAARPDSAARSTIDTDAGVKRSTLLDAERPALHVPAAWASREHRSSRHSTSAASAVDAVTLRVGNPQCVVLGEVTEARLHSIAAALAVHPHFPGGHERRAGGGAGAGSRPDPDLGARRRSDRSVGHRRMRRGRGGASRTAAPRATSRVVSRRRRSASSGWTRGCI